MDVDLQKEIRYFEKRKRKAQQSNDVAEEARLCNAAGELYSHYGEYEKAILEHKQERLLSETSGDDIGVAIAHRKIGECLCELGKYKEALIHEKQHLKIAKTAKSLVEEQRALATIGRTWFVMTDTAADEEELEKCLVEAEKAYLNSLSVCDHLVGDVPQKELYEMRARLYLNIGLIYERRNSTSKAQQFIEKALHIAREHALKDTEYRCFFSLGGCHFAAGHQAQALRDFEKALAVAKHQKDVFMEADVLAQMGEVHLKVGNIRAAKSVLKAAYKISLSKASDEVSTIRENLLSALKIIKLQNTLKKVESQHTKEHLNTLESLGDLYSKIKAGNRAIKYYSKQLDLAKQMEKGGRYLASVYVSLAMCYCDVKDFDKAVELYLIEMDVREGDMRERCDTWCAIAKAYEDAGKDFRTVEEAYNQALRCSEQTDKPKLKIRVLSCLADAQKKYGEMILYKRTTSMVKDLMEEHGLEQDDEINEDSQNLDDTVDEGTEEDDGDDDDDELLSREMSIQDLDGGDSDEEGQVDTAGQRKKRELNKKNEKGETPLHCAAIDGDYEKAKMLLEMGAYIHARDHCGWQPVHEASNHGNLDVLKLLLESGANINDGGGEHCQGITPLHDAAMNGHLEVVRMLVSYGASVNLKNDEGRTPLSACVDLLDDDDGKRETELVTSRKKVIAFLRKCGKSQPNKPQVTQIVRDDPTPERRQELTTRRTSRTPSIVNRNRLLDLSDEEDSEVIDSSAPLPPVGGGDIGTPVIEDSETYSAENNSEVVEHYDLGMDTDDSLEQFSDSPQSPTCYNHTRQTRTRHTQSSNRTKSDSSRDCNGNFQNSRNRVMDFSPDLDSQTDHRLPENDSALISQEGNVYVEDDWLIDDLGTASNKRKFTGSTQTSKQVKRTVQSALCPRKPSSTQRTSRSAPRNLSTRHKKPKQTKLQVIRTPNDPLSDSESLSHERPESPSTVINHHPPVPSCTPVPPVATTAPLRIKVKVQDQVLLIPCPVSNQEDSKTIGWLAEQASLRYFSIHFVRPVLSLTTQEGAWLSSTDIISDVLSNNEQVLARVDSWDLPPLAERYQSACLNLAVGEQKRILDCLKADPNCSSLDLTNFALSSSSVQPLFRALQRHNTLSRLLLAGNMLGDVGVQYLSTALPTLPNLVALDLSANGITHVGLSHISSALTDASNTMVLLQLEVFTVSHNHLTDASGHALSVILSKCPALNTLHVKSCSLTGQAFEPGRPLPNKLKGAVRLHTLSISHNALGNEGLKNFFECIPASSLHHIDISSTLEDFASRLSRSIEIHFHKDSVLQQLFLQDCFIKDEQLPSIMNLSNFKLQTLDLSCNKITDSGAAVIARSLSEGSSLQNLILSGNDVGNEGCVTLLSSLSHSSLESLNLSACHIDSDIDCSVSQLIGMGTGQLRELILSHNDLTLDCKQSLAAEWAQRHHSLADSFIGGTFCVLFLRS